MFRALVIENDQKRSLLYCSFLSKQGYATASAFTATEAFTFFEANHVDIVLCNMFMPNVDGAIITESLREINPNIPIIMLSNDSSIRIKQRAFLAGCDDFMTEPIDLNELELRISALLRRAHSVSKRRVVIGNAVLDSDSFSVVEGNASVALPPKEFMVLFKLCASPGRIFTRRDIMNDVWGIHTESGERTVDVHIKRLRERFENSNSFEIQTVRGIGYRVIERSFDVPTMEL